MALGTDFVELNVAMCWRPGNWELILESRFHVGSRELGRKFRGKGEQYPASIPSSRSPAYPPGD